MRAGCAIPGAIYDLNVITCSLNQMDISYPLSLLLTIDIKSHGHNTINSYFNKP